MSTTKLCSVEGCERPHAAKGFCLPHYKQAKRGTLGKDRTRPSVCGVPGCGRPYLQKGMCKGCYQKAWRESQSPEWRDRELQRSKEYTREYAKANPGKVKQAQRGWYEKNLDYARARGAAYCKQWREAHPERRRETARMWMARNPESVKASRAKQLAALPAYLIRKRHNLPADTPHDVIEVYRLITQVKRAAKDESNRT